jgi:4-amino-4-deoxy-L-arabinose transferase-like glycosyltransferase
MNALRERALPCALFLALALWTLLGLDRPIGNGDESLHAEILRHMLRSGDFLRTRWYGVTLHERPPLTYWLAAPFAFLSSSEIAVRASSALASFVTLLIVYRAALQLWAQRTAAVCAALLLAGVPSYHCLTRTLSSEAPYVLALTCALIGTIWAQRDARALTGALAGLGAATALKGVAVIVPMLALTPWLVRAHALHGDRRSLAYALAVFALLALPYFIIGMLLDAPAFLHQNAEFHMLKHNQRLRSVSGAARSCTCVRCRSAMDP